MVGEVTFVTSVLHTLAVYMGHVLSPGSVCDANWGGLLCEKDLDPCSSLSRCLNGGSCRSSEPGDFQCLCLEGYEGMLYERRTEDCSQRCLNGGTCQSDGDHPVYLCPAGLSGPQCEREGGACTESSCEVPHTVCRSPSCTGEQCEQMGGVCEFCGEQCAGSSWLLSLLPLLSLLLPLGFLVGGLFIFRCCYPSPQRDVPLQTPNNHLIQSPTPPVGGNQKCDLSNQERQKLNGRDTV